MIEENALIPGYSPHLTKEIDAFLLDVEEEVRDARDDSLDWSPSVRALDDLLRRDPVIRMYALEMLEQVPRQHRVASSIHELLIALHLLSTRAPEYNADPKRANFFPASTLFVYMMMTPAGQAIFRIDAFNDCVRDILKAWCGYLDSRQSRNVLHTDESGWLSPSSYERHNLEEYLIPDRSAPHWGFTSFNAFFHRQIKPECRPVADPRNPRVIVSPNDGTFYKVARDIKRTDRFWIKSQPYSLEHMLAGDSLVQLFQGGTVFQSFLDGRNYHRFWAPVSGTIRKIEVIEGLMFSNAESMGEDLTAGTYSQAYMACVNTRSLVFIESDDPVIGMVCLIAVGISEVSSITLTVKAGQTVKKGDEIGRFSYGGSSTCLLFEPDVIRDFTIDTSDTGTVVGSRGAVLKAGQSVALC
ncbi:phophatidylserine decarboxylase associated domain-containing protein [Burkholderia cepacia]|uniref:phophatidylserine decarboxylase associated domain-containing protein n=1 Tax=Burkholderia cepacia TaxID=292 RepID=UPI002AB63F67|nr:phophatidylserine decarboxylase associated domain-containing protein [Burkholderia cepacia]